MLYNLSMTETVLTREINFGAVGRDAPARRLQKPSTSGGPSRPALQIRLDALKIDFRAVLMPGTMPKKKAETLVCADCHFLLYFFLVQC
ncbi:hypothetical protein [Flintibacter muris]|uniref:hypothetical protein n=1 Tax=Flintibacter muris TaxID=2941327 RepID=UPI00203C05B8|nr:hypothetical protein [Flintibacter muris]